MSQNLQNFVKFQKFQLENLVDFEKCCKTHIFLQKSEPIQPKTSNILPKFCQPTLSDVSASERRSMDSRTSTSKTEPAGVLYAVRGPQRVAPVYSRWPPATGREVSLKVEKSFFARRILTHLPRQIPGPVLTASKSQHNLILLWKYVNFLCVFITP